MKETNRIELFDMKARLQSHMHYEKPDEAFDALLLGFEKHTKRYSGFARDARKRGYLPRATAHEFAEYCGYPIDQN